MTDDYEERICNRCDTSDWSELEGARTLYPERRDRDKNKTERSVFICQSCGAEGRRFDDGQSGAITWSGAMRA